VFTTFTIVEIVYSEDINHYAYVVAFLCIVIGLLWGRFKAMHAFGFTVLGLILSGFMGIKHLYSAAVNPSLLTVMALIALTSVLKKQIRLDLALSRLGNAPKTFLIATTTFTALLSALVNNTPVVALLIPAIKGRSKKMGWSSKYFLLPISFAAVAGGTITLIGTSTNLVLNGMMVENGIQGFRFFDFLLPGALVTLGVLITSFLLAPIILKNEHNEEENEIITARNYTTELKVIPGGSMDGLTVKKAKLRNLNDLFLAEIYRNGTFISPVTPEETLEANDTLYFTGGIEHVNELLDQYPDGLKNVEEKFQVEGRSNLLEVIVPNNSDLIGRPLKETNFRLRYDAVIIGVQRNGQPLKGKIGRLVLQAGDLLLLATGKDFGQRNQEETTLIPIGRHDRVAENKLGRERFFLPSLLVIAALGFFLKWTLLITVSLMLISAMACGLTHAEKLKHEFNLQLFSLLVLSVAFGSAVVEGNHAQFFLDNLHLPENSTLAIAGLFALTVLLTNFMTNVSAVANAFPIAAAIMQHYGLNNLDVFLPVAFGASASFLTPTSYQTHLMVMGAGNYSNKDFQKMGLPVLLVYSALALWVLL
jgi:di/tricarboxylate transporter